MQLRRAVPLSLVALLASAGCVSVTPQATAPSRGTGTPAGAPVLPLGPLPQASAAPPVPVPDDVPAPGSSQAPAKELVLPARKRPAKPTPPRRIPRKARPAHPHGVPPVPPGGPGMDALCEAAEGNVPPAIVDLCVGQYGRP
ncbi:hypothetical protein [Streptomyces sp. WAC06614]|uniref:hypothetical protein n=1 Tax=Streptomyces sp. WAC06614 TaxID=2487416 RepID=UPI000F797007|nr:hypothetical protein [Streptomyces sp. WAC06614]RSS51151.1 hypothetical protein EF918_35590 [Streptomyces sp. WAC06614]